MSDDNFKGPGPEEPKPAQGRAGEAKGNDAERALKPSVPALTASDSPAPAPDLPKPARLDDHDFDLDDALSADGAMRFGLDGAAFEPVSAEHRAHVIEAMSKNECNQKSTVNDA